MLSGENKNRAVFARSLLNCFVERITGQNQNRVIDRDPEDTFLVGKLSPIGADNSDLSSATNINRIGLVFLIPKDSLKTAVVKVEPQGYFFYRVLPTAEEQRDFFVRNARKIFGDGRFNDFESAVTYLQSQGEGNNTCDVVRVYERMPIDEESFMVEFKLAEIYNSVKGFGYGSAHDRIKAVLDNKINELYDKNNYYKVIREKVEVKDLLNEESWQNFLKRCCRESKKQTWDFDITCEIKPYKDTAYKVSIFLSNLSPDDKDRKYGRTNTLFNSGLKVKLYGAEFEKITLDYFEDDYKYDKEQEAIGINCTVVYDESKPSELTTTHLPIFEQYRLKTKDEIKVSFDELITDPVKKLSEIKAAMDWEIAKWRNYQTEKNIEFEAAGNINGMKQLSDEIQAFQQEINRFANGIRLINEYDDIRDAFKLMNKAFKNSSKNYSSWRLFQIVFIVSMLADIGTSEYSEEEMGPNCFIDKVDLLYFPTGGGKTEAFLGTIIFTLFFDRLRGKKSGVTAIVKYPLRLLSVQQVERTAQILASAELIRRETEEIKDMDPFSLGYFVGDNNTPNKLTKELIERINQMDPEELNEQYQIVERCPFCGQKNIQIELIEPVMRLVHKCRTEGCKSGGILPIYIVDREIFRYLPSVIISTIDKFAALGTQSDFRNIIGEIVFECPKHGYSGKLKCIEREKGIECNVPTTDYQRVELYDPAPTLLIQDELHLVRESLGVYGAHYETLFQKFIQNWAPKKKKIKIIGATATISAYKEQIYHLYMRDAIRFPCASPYLDENFYSFVDREEIQRLILGLAPFGKAIINSVVYSLKYMKEILWDYYQNPIKMKEIPGIEIDSEEEALRILEDYWIFLQYNNVKLDGNKVLNALDDPINTELEFDKVQPFISEKMTGDDTFQDVRRILVKVETTENVFNGFNLIVATSMISHGVDADKFNIIYFFGMPNNTAEYIQAYSRVGRKYPGLVIMIMRPTREKDQSYLSNFIKFHEFKDILVEPVPINRWATRAIERTFSGILSAIIINYFDFRLQSINSENIYMMEPLQKAITSGQIKKEEIVQMVKDAYCCQDSNLGKQYEEIIENFVEKFLAKIPFEDFSKNSKKNCYISEGLYRLGFLRPMQSLRDTDVPVKLELN